MEEDLIYQIESKVDDDSTTLAQIRMLARFMMVTVSGDLDVRSVRAAIVRSWHKREANMDGMHYVTVRSGRSVTIYETNEFLQRDLKDEECDGAEILRDVYLIKDNVTFKVSFDGCSVYLVHIPFHCTLTLQNGLLTIENLEDNEVNILRINAYDSNRGVLLKKKDARIKAHDEATFNVPEAPFEPPSSEEQSDMFRMEGRPIRLFVAQWLGLTSLKSASRISSRSAIF